MPVRYPLPLLAILEERDRLSREMYDGLARMLNDVGTKVQAAQQCLESGQLEMAECNLEKLLVAVREAHADAHDILVGSGRNDRGPQKLAELLTEHVERLRQQSGVTADLIIAPTWREEAPSPLVRTQLSRLAHEALINISKHADAHHVQVSLGIEAGYAQFRVEDDGRGFFLSRLLPHLLGLAYSFRGLCTMRDRTRAIGGIFRIEASPGQGTRITVQIPLDHQAVQTHF
jgi:signal transduction histidine kinase